ncbi:hypothetical protein [Zoogloea sp.]|uniref:hypothetical protein n=1 Tax=Zoogloea sp. TaxID=49181 RepID=UPI001AC78692|nr:hypothetical protein [Zoogloea sp.]MBN8285005.1 hypothetical protein [Zoogloea sp.]
MRQFWIIVLLLAGSILSGCSVLQGGKLLAPESFGLTPVTPGLYIESGADEATREKLREAMANAENAIRASYGNTSASPIVHACITEECYEGFGGGRGSVAKVYGQRILLSPRGLNWHFLAHEWSHAEMSTRLSFLAWNRLPRWFDEGVAVAISEAPEHSESHWKFLDATNVPRPTREELQTFKSLRQWLDAIHKYGEDQNIERKAKGEPEIRPVYSAAGHELRPWLAKAGSAGLLRFIEQMNEGAAFESAYQTANTAVERDASPQSGSRPSP